MRAEHMRLREKVIDKYVEVKVKKNYVGPVPTYCAAVRLTFDLFV